MGTGFPSARWKYHAGMKALVITEHGGPEVLKVEDLPEPEPAKGQVRVRVVSAGLNRADLLQRMGRYPAPEGFPRDIPGLEYAGEVDAVGGGVETLKPGDRVMGITGGGAMAEKLVVHNRECIPVPDNVDLVEAGGIPEAYLTAWDACWLQGGLRWGRETGGPEQAGSGEGQALLIHAVGSGVGTAALQLAKVAGVKTIGTSRTAEKLEKCKALGLDVGANTANGPAFAEVVGEHARNGVDCVLDLVGGAYFPESLKCLKRGGVHVCVGLVAGRSVEVALGLVLRSRLRIQGTVMRARALGEKISLAKGFAAGVMPHFKTGELKPVIDRILPMDKAAEAHELLASNTTFGKLVLKW